ncbi:hypothetical protein M3Y99_00555000 [Aphelenchoides fujianensis]|nr:hypothetical protein M3Y99_00555000 [Aphelenchoides fujianensis]
MENGIGLSSTASSSAVYFDPFDQPGTSAATANPPTANGFGHPQKPPVGEFRDEFRVKRRAILLAERQAILDRTDPQLRSESAAIYEQREAENHRYREGKKNNSTRSSTMRRWRRRRAERTHDVNGLQMLLYNQLEKLKENLQERVKQMDLLDRRTLDVLELANTPLDFEPQAGDSDDLLTESPTTSNVFDKRDALPGRLASDAAIKADLVFLNQSITPTDADYDVARLIRPRHKVLSRGQRLFVQTTNYTKFAANIARLADEFVHIKARSAGDTRDVYATIEDLRTGRVRIGRKIKQSDTPPSSTNSPLNPSSHSNA